MKILLGHKTKVDTADILKSTIVNENVHGISNDSGFRVVRFDRSKNLIARSIIFPCKI
jgi:hypothetical protein